MKKALVVGSGAGGCAAAAKLAQSFDVTVLEAGDAFRPFAHDVRRLDPMRHLGLFFDERMIQLLFPEMRILKTREGLVHVNGCALGGTTALATGNAVRCDQVLREIGIDLDNEFAELEQVVPVTRDHYKNWSDLTVRLFAAFEDKGLNPQITPKFLVDADRCVACGHCVLGCRFKAKWTADMLIEGNPRISVVTRCAVERVLIKGGRAVGVEARVGGKRCTFEADVVVLAAGGLGTPVLLNASGIPTQSTLFVDPVVCVAAPWEGACLDAQMPMPFVSQRDGYILSPYFDWLSFFFNRQWRSSSDGIMSIMVKYADSSVGSYDGSRLDKPSTPHDEEIVKRSVEESLCILERMGVSRDDMFLGTLNAGHPGGCLPLTSNQAQTLHHEHLPDNLFVADATLLPRSMGNPPILTIMALATRVARCAEESFAD
ncbi:MAG: GMC family oxidoreductase [Eggerthellaceae bacterium]|nr:GMC family oxidoreductase [Eggerthellaceae bacterium]